MAGLSPFQGIKGEQEVLVEQGRNLGRLYVPGLSI